METMKFLLPLFALVVAPVVTDAGAQRRTDQEMAFQARQAGALMPLRSIESGIVPDMKRRGADYIGAELDGGSARYRLKFVRDGSVIWIDVDGRTGAVLARAGE
jgi:uncharacterized membrane protein YkoI